MKAWRTGGAALLAAAALHGAGWLYASQRVRSGAEAYLDSLRGEGWTITHMPVRLAGWPLAAAVQVPGFAADGSGAGVPVAWTATEVRIGVAATQPGTVRITLRFNSRIDQARSRLALRSPGKERVLPVAPSGAEDVLAAQADLVPGDYTLRWQVLAVDGHITRGDVPFQVKAP